MKKEENFLKKFESHIKEFKLLDYKNRILIGFSGGSDSTALLTAMYHLRSKYRWYLLAAHINFHLRGEESKKEEKFVKDFCFSRNISILVNHYDPAGKKLNENRLRQYRHEWFNKLIKLYKLDTIVLGHNQHDQAETIIFRLMRGSLLTGLAGIHSRFGKTIHPLLSFSRDEIIDYLKQEKCRWCEDSSNYEKAFMRNKLRHIAIPWIEENINPRIIDTVSGMATFLQEADSVMRNTAKTKLRHIIEEKNVDEIKISIEGLFKIKPILRFYIYRILYSKFSGTKQDFYQSNYEYIEKSLKKEGNREIQLPKNVIFLKEYQFLRIYKKNFSKDSNLENPREILSLRNRFIYNGWRISMKKLKKLPDNIHKFRDKKIAYLDFDKLEWPLVVRHRIPGDQFVPFGMKHKKKLKNYFIDIKLPVENRTQTLIFTDQNQIIWIGGHRIDNRFAVQPETNNILMLKIERIRHRKSRPAERMKK